MRTLYLSVDPSQRYRMAGSRLLGQGEQIGEVMAGVVVGEVCESNDLRVAKGDIVSAALGWQEYGVAPAKSLRRVDPAPAPVTAALYVLGLPGLAAYFGMLEICRPLAGETVVVSGAAGAVGSLAGQIAKIKRCRAVGIAGSDEKVGYLTKELGFDSAFNYKATPDYSARLKELCPNGVDVYFDTVGGAITDAVMPAINTRARIAVCGQSSLYNSVEPDTGPRWFGQLVLRQAKVEGFLVHQFADRFEEGHRQLGTWLREKRIRYREEVTDGLENAPKALIGMLEGRNIGRQLVRVGEQGEAEHLTARAAG